MQIAEIKPIANLTVFLIALVFVGFVMFVMLVLMIWMLRPWVKAFTSGTPISVFQIIGMRFRKVDLGLVLDQGIAANQAGFPVSWNDLESAYLQGVDLERLTTAYIAAQKRELGFTFQELVDADRDDRLEKLLQS